MVISVRDATPEDNGPIAHLLGLLGYPTPERDVGARLRSAGEAGGVVVAEDDGGCVGLAAYQLVYHFETGAPRCRLTALVVDADQRTKGAGRALVAEVESRAAAAGCTSAELTSSRPPRRDAAHRFYPAIGFVDAGERSVFYVKDLPLGK
jgi:GNAT superfamily N-acetyltransferase